MSVTLMTDTATFDLDRAGQSSSEIGAADGERQRGDHGAERRGQPQGKGRVTEEDGEHEAGDALHGVVAATTARRNGVAVHRAAGFWPLLGSGRRSTEV